MYFFTLQFRIVYNLIGIFFIDKWVSNRNIIVSSTNGVKNPWTYKSSKTKKKHS